MYANPEEHAANPPETWKVVKCHRDVLGGWAITDKQGVVLEKARTKGEAEARIRNRTGFSARLWDDERRWFAGERVNGWKPYAEVARMKGGDK